MADNNAQEPSMEEILASIRRIISEDGEEGDVPAQQAEAAQENPPIEDEVLDLEEAEIIEEEEVLEEIEEAEAPLEAADVMEDEPAALAEEPEVLELDDMVEETQKADPSEEILSKDAAQKAAEPFSQLSGLLVRDYEGAGNTLDGLVREMLRPMLKEWLDENLPNVVERMVAKEIARLTNRD